MEGVGGRWARWVMGIKESTWCDEQWLLYISCQSLNSTPETNIALYINLRKKAGKKKKKKKKKKKQGAARCPRPDTALA